MTNERGGEKVALLSYLLDEYKYRHDLCWRLVFRLSSVVALLSVIPYIKDELTGQLGRWMLSPPLLATFLAGFGILVMRNELILFHGSVKSYHHLQDKFFDDVIDDEKTREEVKHPEVEGKGIKQVFFSKFDTFVMIYLVALLILSAWNCLFLYATWIPYMKKSYSGGIPGFPG